MSPEKLLRDHIAVLDEIIRAGREANQKSAAISPTEYFAVIVTALFSGNVRNDQMETFIEILSITLPRTNSNVLKEYFKQICGYFMKLLSDAKSNTHVTQLSLQILCDVMVFQDKSDGFWRNAVPLQAVNAILQFVDTDNVQLRKTVFAGIKKIFFEHKNANCIAFRAYAVDFIVHACNACTRANYYRALCCVALLEDVSTMLPNDMVGSVGESLIGLQRCEIARLTTAVYRTFDALFQGARDEAFPAAELFDMLLKTVQRDFSGHSDVEAQCIALGALTSGLILCEKFHGFSTVKNRGAACRLNKLLDLVLGVLKQSDIMQARVQVFVSLKRIVRFNMVENVGDVADVRQWSKAFLNGPTSDLQLPPLIVMASEIATFLIHSISVDNSNEYMFLVLEAITVLLQSLRTVALDESTATHFLTPLVNKLCEVFVSIESMHEPAEESNASLVVARNQAIQALGCSVNLVGMESFLTLFPLFNNQRKTKTGDIDLSINYWVLTILNEAAKSIFSPAKLSEFLSFVLPLADNANSLLESIRSNSSDLQQIVVEIWKIFSSYFENNTLSDMDVGLPEAFATIKFHLLDTSAGVEGYQGEMRANMLNGLINACDKCRGSIADIVVLDISTTLLKFIEMHANRFSDHDNMTEVIECSKLSMKAFRKWIVLCSEKFRNNVIKKLMQVVLANSATLIGGDAMDVDSSSLDATNVFMNLLLMLLCDESDTAVFMSDSTLKVLYESIQPFLRCDQVHDEVGGKAAFKIICKRSYQILEMLLEYKIEQLFRVCTKDAESSASSVILRVIQTKIVPRNLLYHQVSCVFALVRQCLKRNDVTIVTQMLTDSVLLLRVIQGMKDPNKKTREICVELWNLLCCQVQSEGALLGFLHTVLTSADHHAARGAAIFGLSIVLKEKAKWCKGREETDMNEFRSIFSACLQLLPAVEMVVSHGETADQQKTEHAKEILNLLKVVVVVGAKEDVAAYLVPMLTLVFYTLSSNLRAKFSSQIRSLMRKLLLRKSFEVEELAKHMPREHHALLEYILKEHRKSTAKSAQRKRAISTDQMDIDAELLDSDDDQAREEACTTSKTQTTSVREIEVAEDYRLVKRQQGKFKRLRSSSFDDHTGPKDDAEGRLPELELQFNAEGKLVLKAREEDNVTTHTTPKETEVANAPSNNDFAGKRKKLKAVAAFSNLRAPGIEYKAKRAGGDVWKKGQAIQPHAYIPLDPRLLSKKHKDKAVEHFGAVVGGKKFRKSHK